MTRPFRFLGQASSSNATAIESVDSVTVDSDFVVILAALLCALICVLGLVAVARCAWLRRLSTSRAVASATASSSPETETASTAPSSAVAAASLANKGLKKKILKSLPKLTFTAESAAKFSSSECAICLSEFAPGDEILVLPQCGHAFHVACIQTWLGSHSSCPSCRQILVVARCHKCGVPQAEARFKERVDDANRFLP
ncbi:RING-H2 finger protein ATL80 [Juglans microcarpa x Juglans regia]|uniref:RING-H2 finger protein ATL80 n=1 Tax=Juglans microcarpa x Juglans regia TaxID=2249226 RepID=UPI001B7F25BB|nr:RING-H2 finger protein ATL80 [Juglans microcarpa x Juglans regia]